MTDKSPPKVFISYSHDSPEHTARVLELSDALRHHGIEAILDQYNPVPDEGWPLWMDRNLLDANFVVLICTLRYLRRYLRQESPGVGQGVQWESNLNANALYNDLSQGKRYLPVLLDGADPANIPGPYQGFTRFPLTQFDINDVQYQALYRHLTDQLGTPQPVLGPLVVLDAVPRKSVQSVPKQLPWNVPFSRNPFFTGREDTLALLAETLQTGKAAAITQAAISGLGGIGKTQTAVEFAYRHRNEYNAVLWMKAENETTLRESCIDVARVLRLPEANEQDQNLAIEATKLWLATNHTWLLILDNADDLSVANSFLPKSHQGRVLFTSRASVTGKHAKAVPIEKFSIEDGTLLLLRRATRIGETATLDAADPKDVEAARAISNVVDGLPLALDQAGAYLEATKLSPADYLSLYQKNAPGLLARYGKPGDRDHDSVVVTFSLAFEQTNKDNPVVGDLLRMCAFLAPDDIPEMIFTQGKSNVLGQALHTVATDELEWHDFVVAACRYSLVTRKQDSRMLSMHRLVQLVLRNAMEESEHRDWAERAINAVCKAFPNAEFRNWPLCDQLLPHAQVCAEWRRTFEIDTIQAGLLANRTGYYLNERAQYDQVEPLYLEALSIYRNQLGSDHPDTASSLNNLAGLYVSQGRYVDAEPLYLEALEISRVQLGSDHPDTASSLNNLATLYVSQGRYVDAEPLLLEALEIRKRHLGSDHPDTASSLNNLATLYDDQGRYEEAEPLYLEALEISRVQLGSDHPDTAISLGNLAGLYYGQGDYIKAKSYIEEAHPIFLKMLGAEHPNTVTSQNWYDAIVAALEEQ